MVSLPETVKIFSRISGPPKSSCFPGGRRLPQIPRSGARHPGPSFAQAGIARTATEHEGLMARNMMSDHTCSGRPLPTCKTSIVVTATILTLFKANTKEITKEVAQPNIEASTTILVLHVSNGRSEHMWLDTMFLAINVHHFSICSTSCNKVLLL